MKFLNLLTDEEIELEETVEVINSNEDIPLIISIPHTSPLVPTQYMQNRKWDKNILRDTDLHTDKLYNIAIGIKIIGKCNPYFINYSRPRNSFVEQRGILPWQFLDGQDLMLKEYTSDEIHHILLEYDKYHKEIQKHIDEIKEKHGFVLIIDGHSMAKEPLNGSLAGQSEEKRPDLCIGTLDGQTIPQNINQLINDTLAESNYTFKFNNPYKGGFITQKFSSQENVYVIQIEAVKENYMNNETYEINNKFDDFKSVIENLIKEIVKELK